MKATDLRVGNYYKWTDKNHNFEDCDVYQIDSISSISLIEEYFKYFEPILITEEWLLKFGFKKGVKGWFKTLDNNLKFNLYMYNRSLYLSVHQLQNLYFALTNNELTLNKTITK